MDVQEQHGNDYRADDRLAAAEMVQHSGAGPSDVLRCDLDQVGQPFLSQIAEHDEAELELPVH